jgi:hypothetical protein
MKVVRDLQADVYRMWGAFVLARGYPHLSAVRPFRNPRYQAILAGKRNARVGFSKPYHRTRLCARDKTSPMNRHFTARNGCRGRNPLNVRNAVFFWRRAEPEFHTQPM